VPRRGKWLQLIDQALFNLINADWFAVVWQRKAPKCSHPWVE
jgi:hypothetical protein